MTFYVFLKRHFKKRKKSCFLEIRKNEKYVFSNTDDDDDDDDEREHGVWYSCWAHVGAVISFKLIEDRRESN